MAAPVLEIAIVNIKDRNVEDETTPEGKLWHQIFHDVTDVPGFKQVAWGRSNKDRDTNLFCVDWESYKHHHEFMEAYGTLSKPIMDLIHGPFDMYHISTNSQARECFSAPCSAMVYLWGVDDAKFTELSPEFALSIGQSDSNVGWVWGEAINPARADPCGNLKLGKGIIMISGWKSKEAHDIDVARSRVVNAYKALQAAVKKSETYTVQFRVVLKSKDEMSWRRL